MEFPTALMNLVAECYAGLQPKAFYVLPAGRLQRAMIKDHNELQLLRRACESHCECAPPNILSDEGKGCPGMHHYPKCPKFVPMLHALQIEDSPTPSVLRGAAK